MFKTFVSQSPLRLVLLSSLRSATVWLPAFATGWRTFLVFQNVEPLLLQFLRERNMDTGEWEVPLAVYEEAADANLVDRSLLGWTNDTLRIRFRADLGQVAEPEYLVRIPYTEKKRILEKYTTVRPRGRRGR